MNKILTTFTANLGLITSLLASDTLITRERIGVLDTSLSEIQIIEQFGQEVVSTRELFVEGELLATQTLLFEGTPRELIINWEDEETRDKISSVSIEQPESPYATSNGIRVGLPLTELVKLNDNIPIQFYGFGWDYSGYMPRFTKGPLSESYPWLAAVVGLSDADWEKYGNTLMNELAGDELQSSDLPAAKEIPLKLVNLIINVEAGESVSETGPDDETGLPSEE